MVPRQLLHWRAPAVLRTLLGAAALVGLFAMHGLASHGAMHTGHSDQPLPVTMAVEHTHVAIEMSVGMAADAAATFTAPTPTTPDGDGLGLAGLCLAVLLVGVFAAILLGRRTVHLQLRELADSVRGWPARARRERDPPCLVALSIQRC